MTKFYANDPPYCKIKTRKNYCSYEDFSTVFKMARKQCEKIAGERGWQEAMVIIPIGLDCAHEDGSFCKDDVAHSALVIKKGEYVFVYDNRIRSNKYAEWHEHLINFVYDQLKGDTSVTVVRYETLEECSLRPIPNMCRYDGILGIMDIEIPQFEAIMTVLNHMRHDAFPVQCRTKQVPDS